MTERHRSQRGLSVVELMVALLLASFLTMGMVYIFTSNSDTFRLNEASARVQESGRMAADILGRAVRNAGYWGCMTPPPDQDCPGGGEGDNPFSCMLNDGGLDWDKFFSSLSGDNNVGATNTFGAVEGSDVIQFGGVQSNALLTTTDQTPNNSSTIFTGQNPTGQVEEGEILIINDCEAADIFQATDVQNNAVVANTGNSRTPGNDTSTQSDYEPGASLMRPSRNAYYIRPDGNGNRSLVFEPMDLHDDGSGTVGDFAGHEELVSNVWGLQIQFGRDTTGDEQVDTWSDPSTLDEADETLAVRYSLLVRSSSEDVVEEPQSYCYPGWLDCESNSSLRTTAGDRHLYRVYTSVSTLRNRVGG